MEIISFYLIIVISFYPWLQIKWNQFLWFYNIFIYHYWSLINVCCWIFIWIKSIVLETSWRWFFSIRVLEFWFNFSKCLNFKIHSLMNAFHLIEILLDSLFIQICSRRVLMFPFRSKKFLFTLNFNNYFFCLFIIHISKFGKFWDVTGYHP